MYETSELRLMYYARPVGNEISNDPGVERTTYPNCVSSCGAVERQCARDLERLGHYGQVILKSDQEPAIVDVLLETANLRGSRGTFLEIRRL